MFSFFRKKTNPAIEPLYQTVIAQARTPIFYQSYGVPDTLDGRFDMIVFHLTPLIDQLRDEEGAITPDGQALFDRFVDDMEDNLRTLGVGDTSVPKKMKKMGEAFYGRFAAYREAFDNDDSLRTAIARNVLGAESLADEAATAALAEYARAMRASAEASDVLSGFAFPDPEEFLPAPEGVRS